MFMKNSLTSFFGLWNWNWRFNVKLVHMVERCSMNQDLSDENLINGVVETW